MQITCVRPVGLVEHPASYSSFMLAYSAKTRSTALLGLGAFLVVSVTTTVLSLGVYCLTRYASLPFMFFPVAVAG